MKRWTVLVGAMLLLLAAHQAVALPPPWKIEEWKGQADLIVIAKAGKIEPVGNMRGIDSKVGLEVVEVLKGKLTEKEQASLAMVFRAPAPPPVGPGVHAMIVGGTGSPKVREGQPALVFLKKNPRADHYQAASGGFGYVDLGAGTDEEAANVKRTIARYQQWTGKIGDEAVRKAMEGYYQKALALVNKERKDAAGGE